MGQNNYSDKIGCASLLVAIVAIIVSFTVPEVRKLLGLSPEGPSTRENNEETVKVIDSIVFSDTVLIGNIKKEDINSFFDRKVVGGFGPEEPLELLCDTLPIEIYTCRDFFNANRANCYPNNGYAEKEYNQYNTTCTLLKSIRNGHLPKKSYLPKHILEELPSIFIEEPFINSLEDSTILIQINKNTFSKRIKDIDIIQLDNRATLEIPREYICDLHELLRIDINNDGIEDSLIKKWIWTGGSMTITELWWVTFKENGKIRMFMAD